MNVFPECHRNLSKVTTNEAETEKKNPIFFPGYTALCIKNFAKIICNTEIFYVNLYKEYTSLKSRELEELLRFQVMSWQPS